MVMNRRIFLKGLIGAAAVAMVAPGAMADQYRIIPGDPTPNRGGDLFPPKKAVAHVDVGPGIIHIDGVHVVPGDKVMIQYSHNSKDNGIYEVKAVHIDGGEVTIAHVENGRTTDHRMPMDELEPYLNREIRRTQARQPHTIGIDYGQGRDKSAVTWGRITPNRVIPKKTWPKSRRRRGRA